MQWRQARRAEVAPVLQLRPGSGPAQVGDWESAPEQDVFLVKSGEQTVFVLDRADNTLASPLSIAITNGKNSDVLRINNEAADNKIGYLFMVVKPRGLAREKEMAKELEEKRRQEREAALEAERNRDLGESVTRLFD